LYGLADSVFFSSDRPAIQYRSSTEGPAGDITVSIIELGYMYDHCHHCSGGGVCEWGTCIARGVGSAGHRLLLIWLLC